MKMILHSQAVQIRSATLYCSWLLFDLFQSNHYRTAVNEDGPPPLSKQPPTLITEICSCNTVAGFNELENAFVSSNSCIMNLTDDTVGEIASTFDVDVVVIIFSFSFLLHITCVLSAEEYARHGDMLRKKLFYLHLSLLLIEWDHLFGAAIFKHGRKVQCLPKTETSMRASLYHNHKTLFRSWLACWIKLYMAMCCAESTFHLSLCPVCWCSVSSHLCTNLVISREASVLPPCDKQLVASTLSSVPARVDVTPPKAREKSVPWERSRAGGVLLSSPLFSFTTSRPAAENHRHPSSSHQSTRWCARRPTLLAQDIPSWLSI